MVNTMTKKHYIFLQEREEFFRELQDERNLTRSEIDEYIAILTELEIEDNYDGLKTLAKN